MIRIRAVPSGRCESRLRGHHIMRTHDEASKTMARDGMCETAIYGGELERTDADE